LPTEAHDAGGFHGVQVVLNPPQNPFLLSAVMRLAESLALTRFARLSAAALTLITSTFFLLCSFTFSYTNIVRNANVLWISKLVHAYSHLYWAAFLLNAVTLLPAFSHRISRWWTEALLLVLATIGLLMTRVYFLWDVPLSSSDIVWSAVLTLPLLCFGIHDIAVFGGPSVWTRQSAGKNLSLLAAFLLGGLVGLWYFIVALFRYQDSPTHCASILPVLAVTLLLHGCMFACLIAALSSIRCLMLRMRLSSRTQWIGVLAMIWMLASWMLRKLVTPALSFNNLRADAWALAFPLSFLVMLAGWQIRRSSLGNQAVPAQAESVVSGLIPSGRLWTFLAAGCALLCPVAIPIGVERVDWNFLFQRLGAVAVWVLVLTVSWRTVARPTAQPHSFWKMLALATAMAAGCIALAQTNRVWHRLGLKSVSQSSAAYSGMDTSFQVAQILFRPMIRDDDATGLFAYLRRNSLIGDPIGPPKLGLVESLSPTPGPKPNIYIIVVDCLRRDYISPYNPRVQFTPNIASFAQESIVFQHAYTSYGGTALSEPAIWAGVMTPSVQNPQPFSEMNALEQLTIVDGYHRLLLRDMVLNRVLRKLSTDALLPVVSREHMPFDLRDEVPEILGRDTGNQGPLFVYAQPQNLHPITLHELAEEGEKPQGNYPGFNARYADALHQVDAAFGQLVEGLKARGKYDNSIVILTGDHGDWLGEYGRWGHGQFLLPPILEVPLLIHLPSGLAGRFYYDVNQTVFLTDIAPSLLYLRGHRGLRREEFFGRPLFTQRADEQKDYFQRYRLFMSSYAAIFGILDEQTQTLYMADAVDENQSLYNIAEDRYGLDNIIDKESQSRFEQLTRASIERLNAVYGYAAHQN